MSQFHKLTIADIKNETPDTVSVAFHLDDNQKESFKYISGQYLTLSFLINGSEERRSYSLCSSLHSQELIRVAVKKVENGLVSTYINEKLNIGLKKGNLLKTGGYNKHTQKKKLKKFKREDNSLILNYTEAEFEVELGAN